jgi:uncharacterized coiled-coil DUF342 family protein
LFLDKWISIRYHILDKCECTWKVNSHQPLLKTAEQSVDKLARMRKSRNRWKDKAVSRASQIREIRKKINRIDAEILNLEAEIAARRFAAKLIEEEVGNGG